MLGKLLLNFLKPYKLKLLLVSILLLAQTTANLYVPSLNADIINEGIAKADTSYIWRIGGFMLAVTAIQAIFAVIAAYYSSFISMSFERDLRRSIFAKVMSFSTKEMDQFSTGSLITRNTNDVSQVRILVYVGLTILISAPITMIGGVILALRHNTSLSGLIAVLVPVMGLVVGILIRKSTPLFRVVQTRIDAINSTLREQITGTRVIRAFVQDSQERTRFNKANQELRDTQLKINRIMAFGMPSLMLIMNFASIAVVWFGGHLVANGEMQIGDISAFMAYMMQILVSVMMATMGIIMVPRAIASAERITETLSANNEIVDPEKPIPVTSSGLIQIKNLQFKYPGAESPVLSDINFTINPGEFVAIVGGTGSGKSTLINLLMRFYDPSSGSVSINGVDIRSQNLQELWKRQALVPQKALLFSGSVRDNVRFGAEEISDEEVWRALEVAQASDFVKELENQLDSPISQGGTNLSGGQKQRLAIARAIATKPTIYIFDDAFSALDATTDAKLRAALRTQTAGATVLVVAQRVSTIMHADRIIVLDEGRVVGIDSHEALLKTCAAYREIVGSQLDVTL